MLLNSLSLQNFRSYTTSSFEFSPQTNLFIGPNGSGKTNILEAIYMLTGAPSFRAPKMSYLINWSSNYTIISTQTDNGQTFEIKIKTDQASRKIFKSFHIDGVIKTRKAFLGQIKAVIFQPDDIRLITGSPSRRRQYVDLFLSSLDWQYRSNLYQYQKALRQRNQLLQLISLHKAKTEQLFYWDNSLIKSGIFIQQSRNTLFTNLNHFFQNHPNSDINPISIIYKPIPISQTLLAQRLNQDTVTGQTSLGPHRDDYFFKNSNLKSDSDLSALGSRGQQRIAIFSLKIGEINYIESRFAQKPILLLDDIFSELDPNHQQSLSNLCYNYQAFITTSQHKDKHFLPNAKIYNL